MPVINTDEFSSKRYKKLSLAFVDLYIQEGEIPAAKLLVDAELPEQDLMFIRDEVQREFLRRGWTFPEEVI